MRSVIMHPTDTSKWDQLSYRRRLETFGVDDGPVIAAGPGGEFDAVWYILRNLFSVNNTLITIT
jgi:acid phosphatase